MARSPGMTDGDCFGSVLLHDELRRSLASTNGQGAPWGLGCALENRHDGDHRAPRGQAEGEAQQWIRWANAGPGRLERVEQSLPGRHTMPPRTPPRPLKPHPDPPTQPIDNYRAGPPGATEVPAGATGVPAAGSQSEAL